MQDVPGGGVGPSVPVGGAACTHTEHLCEWSVCVDPQRSGASVVVGQVCENKKLAMRCGGGGHAVSMLSSCCVHVVAMLYSCCIPWSSCCIRFVCVLYSQRVRIVFVVSILLRANRVRFTNFDQL